MVEFLAGLALWAAIFLLIHQQLATNDGWFNWPEFWQHESFIVSALVAAIALLIGKYLGRSSHK